MKRRSLPCDRRQQNGSVERQVVEQLKACKASSRSGYRVRPGYLLNGYELNRAARSCDSCETRLPVVFLHAPTLQSAL